jgi:TctA family transporter
MAQQGRAGIALFAISVASFFGGISGVIVMVVLAPRLAEFALLFQPAEYCQVMVPGLIAASVVSSSGALRGPVMVCLGILPGTIVIDVNSAESGFSRMRRWRHACRRDPGHRGQYCLTQRPVQACV